MLKGRLFLLLLLSFSCNLICSVRVLEISPRLPENFQVIKDVINTSERQGYLSVEFPGPILSKSFVTFEQFSQAVMNESSLRIDLHAKRSEDESLQGYLEFLGDHLDQKEELNTLMVAILLAKHKFVKLALIKYPFWMYLTNVMGRNALHFMALAGSVELHRWCWETALVLGQGNLSSIFSMFEDRSKFPYVTNYTFFLDPVRALKLENDKNTFRYAFLVGWLQVDRAFSTPLQYIFDSGSDDFIERIINMAPSNIFVIYQNSKNAVQSLTERFKFGILKSLMDRFPFLPLSITVAQGGLAHYLAHAWREPDAKPLIKEIWSNFPVTFVDKRCLNGYAPLDIIPSAERFRFVPDELCLKEIFHELETKSLHGPVRFDLPAVKYLKDLNVTYINGTLARELGLLDGKLFTLPEATDKHLKLLTAFVSEGRTDLIGNMLERYDFVGKHKMALVELYMVAAPNKTIFQSMISYKHNFVNLRCRKELIKFLETQNSIHTIAGASFPTLLVLEKYEEALEVLVSFYPEVLHTLDEMRRTAMFYAVATRNLPALVAIFRSYSKLKYPIFDIIDQEYCPLAYIAAQIDYWKVINFFLDTQLIQPLVVGNLGYGFIHLAVKSQPEESVRRLIDMYVGRDSDLGGCVTSSQRNILHLAFLNPHMTISFFRYLYYLDPSMAHQKDAYFLTPLEFAIEIKGSCFCIGCRKFLARKMVSTTKNDPEIGVEHEGIDVCDKTFDDKTETDLIASANISGSNLSVNGTSNKKQKKKSRKKQRKRNNPDENRTIISETIMNETNVVVNDDHNENENDIIATGDTVAEKRRLERRESSVTESSISSFMTAKTSPSFFGGVDADPDSDPYPYPYPDIDEEVDDAYEVNFESDKKILLDLAMARTSSFTHSDTGTEMTVGRKTPKSKGKSFDPSSPTHSFISSSSSSSRQLSPAPALPALPVSLPLSLRSLSPPSPSSSSSSSSLKSKKTFSKWSQTPAKHDGDDVGRKSKGIQAVAKITLKNKQSQTNESDSKKENDPNPHNPYPSNVNYDNNNNNNNNNNEENIDFWDFETVTRSQIHEIVEQYMFHRTPSVAWALKKITNIQDAGIIYDDMKMEKVSNMFVLWCLVMESMDPMMTITKLNSNRRRESKSSSHEISSYLDDDGNINDNNINYNNINYNNINYNNINDNNINDNNINENYNHFHTRPNNGFYHQNVPLHLHQETTIFRSNLNKLAQLIHAFVLSRNSMIDGSSSTATTNHLNDETLTLINYLQFNLLPSFILISNEGEGEGEGERHQLVLDHDDTTKDIIFGLWASLIGVGLLSQDSAMMAMDASYYQVLARENHKRSVFWSFLSDYVPPYHH